MIDKRPGASVGEVNYLAVVVLYRQQSGLPQNAVGIGDVINGRNDVFAGGKPNEVSSLISRFRCGRELADNGIKLLHGPLCSRAIRSSLLGGVIELRQ